MLNMDLDTFIDKYLLGAFPNWTQTAYEAAFWREKLQDIAFEDAKKALKEYFGSETFGKPKWNKFRAYLSEIEHSRPRADGMNSIVAFRVAAQCVASVKLNKVGSFWRWTQETEPSHYGNWAEALQIDMAQMYGGVWDITTESIAVQRNRFPKQAAKNNPRLASEPRMFYLDEFIPADWQPVITEIVEQKELRRQRDFYEPENINF